MLKAGFVAALTGALLGASALAQAEELTIATVNNADMIIMQKLAPKWEQATGNKINWVVLEENVLRQRVTTDIATKGGQFDIITIGSYETPIWGKQGWLVPVSDLGDDYDYADMIPSVMNGLSYDGKLYAVPFYAESSFTFYRKDLFEAAGIKMPDKPTYDQIAEYAAKLTDKSKEQYGFCQRGKPGWGENMAFVGPMVNAFGGQWFDMDWKPQLDQRAMEDGGQLLCEEHERVRASGRHRQRPQREPGAVRHRPLRHVGRCHLGRRLHLQPQGEPGRRQDLVRAGADRGDQQRLGLVLGLGARHPELVAEGRRRQVVREVGDLEGLRRRRSARRSAGSSAPPGTRKSTYDNPKYKAGGAVRRGRLQVDHQRRHHQADQGSGAVRRHPVRRASPSSRGSAPPSASRSPRRSPAR